MIERDNLLDRAQKLSDRFRQRLLSLANQCDIVQEVRILGLMIGIELAVDAAPVVAACMERRVLVNHTQGNVVRLLPAMTLTDEQADEGCQVVEQVISQLEV